MTNESQRIKPEDIPTTRNSTPPNEIFTQYKTPETDNIHEIVIDQHHIRVSFFYKTEKLLGGRWLTVSPELLSYLAENAASIVDNYKTYVQTETAKFEDRIKEKPDLTDI